MLCEIAGHADAGMTGTLMVTADGGVMPDDEVAGSSDDADDEHFHGYNSAEEMQAAMDARAMRFVEEDKGEFGGQLLDYTVSDDGFKVFDVTAEIVDWEVEPGNVVQAYTYNGTVPAPEIHVEVGDLVRVVLRNELPVGTVIHWHGILVPPNSMDGVPPFTQPAVMPGETFTYEFEALEPAAGSTTRTTGRTKCSTACSARSPSEAWRHRRASSNKASPPNRTRRSTWCSTMPA